MTHGLVEEMALDGLTVHARRWEPDQPRPEAVPLLARGRVFPTKITVAPVAGRTWRARWQEQTKDNDGNVIEDVGWEATIELVLVNPATQKKEERQRSPLGIWIANIAWQPI